MEAKKFEMLRLLLQTQVETLNEMEKDGNKNDEAAVIVANYTKKSIDNLVLGLPHPFTRDEKDKEN